MQRSRTVEIGFHRGGRNSTSSCEKGLAVSGTLQRKILATDCQYQKPKNPFGDAPLPLDLRNVLSRIADHPINGIEELLPWNLSAELAEKQIVTA